jgi:hypothetical protein
VRISSLGTNKWVRLFAAVVLVFIGLAKHYDEYIVNDKINPVDYSCTLDTDCAPKTLGSRCIDAVACVNDEWNHYTGILNRGIFRDRRIDVCKRTDLVAFGEFNYPTKMQCECNTNRCEGKQVPNLPEPMAPSMYTPITTSAFEISTVAGEREALRVRIMNDVQVPGIGGSYSDVAQMRPIISCAVGGTEQVIDIATEEVEPADISWGEIKDYTYMFSIHLNASIGVHDCIVQAAVGEAGAANRVYNGEELQPANLVIRIKA